MISIFNLKDSYRATGLMSFMLRAKKSLWFERLFAFYNRNLLRRRFHSLKVGNLERLLGRHPRRKIPLLIYANHSSWWDGLVAFEISRLSGLDAFVMMEEKHLKKLFLFRRLGAFSIVRENPRQAAVSISYAADLLGQGTNRALWIFPQGEIRRQDARPLGFYHGAARIIEKLEKCEALPLAIRFEFTGEFKPEIFARIGAPEALEPDENFNAKQLTKRLETNLTQLLDVLKEDVLANNLDNYSKIF
jgi:1-acyl-sn-glycerol-3-phosphate acyltransferase